MVPSMAEIARMWNEGTLCLPLPEFPGPAANSNHQCRPPAMQAYSEWRRHASRSGRLCRHFAGCQGDAVIFQLDVLRSRDPAVGPTHWLDGSSWREEARSSPAAPRSSVEHTEGFDISIVSREPPAGLRGLERRDPATGEHICPCKRLKVSRSQGTASIQNLLPSPLHHLCPGAPSGYGFQASAPTGLLSFKIVDHRTPYSSLAPGQPTN